MSFLVDEGGIGEGRDEGSIDSEGAVTYAEEGGEEARDDENGQQDDQRGCETGRRHADETLALGTRRENDGGRVVLGLLQSERQITRRHHLDDAVDTNVLALGLGDVTTTTWLS